MTPVAERTLITVVLAVAVAAAALSIAAIETGGSDDPLVDGRSPTDSVAGPVASEQASDQAEPSAIRIPEIEIDHAPIVAIDGEPNEGWVVPGTPQVGWYRTGSSPGRAGTTVLVAPLAIGDDDVDDVEDDGGVFDDLGAVEIGMSVEVELSDGSVARYEVVDVARHDESDPLPNLLTEKGAERLALVAPGARSERTAGPVGPTIVAHAEPVEIVTAP